MKSKLKTLKFPADRKKMKKVLKKNKWPVKNDHDADDKKKRKKVVKKAAVKKSPIKDTGSFEGKSNRLGQGGRAAQLRARGVPGGVIGNLARRAHAAPGQANYHKKKK